MALWVSGSSSLELSSFEAVDLLDSSDAGISLSKKSVYESTQAILEVK